MFSLAAVECLAGYACMTLSVVADAPKVVVRSVGKEDVGAQIDRLRRALEAPAEAGKRRRSIAASIVTSTSASFGTGLLVVSEPSRAIRRTPGDDLAARTKGRLNATFRAFAQDATVCDIKNEDRVPILSLSGMDGRQNLVVFVEKRCPGFGAGCLRRVQCELCEKTLTCCIPSSDVLQEIA